MKKEKGILETPTIAPRKTSMWNWLFLCLAIIPVFLLFDLIGNYSVNIPYNDDWDAILAFLNGWIHSDRKMALLFSQHNEHRILSSKLIYTSFYGLFNNISILSIIYIANIQLLVVAGVLAYFIRKVLNIQYLWGLLIFIVCLCVFDPSSYDNSDFAMAGLQNYGVVMLFSLSLFCYSLKSKSRIELLFALLFQFLCAFSSGNGFMAGIALLFYNVFSKDRVKWIVCISGVIVFTAFYFLSYQSVGHDNGFKAKTVWMFVSYFLKLSGSHFNFESGVRIAVLLYAIFFGTLLYKVKNIEWQKILPFLSLFLFVTMSMAAIALFRSGQQHIFDSESISSRYLIYPQLLSIVVFIMLVHRLEHFKYYTVVMAICSLLFIKAYKENYHYGAEAFEARSRRLSFNKFVYPDKMRAQKITKESCENGIYCIDEYRP